jgi:hypothetical protein
MVQGWRGGVGQAPLDSISAQSAIKILRSHAAARATPAHDQASQPAGERGGPAPMLPCCQRVASVALWLAIFVYNILTTLMISSCYQLLSKQLSCRRHATHDLFSARRYRATDRATSTSRSPPDSPIRVGGQQRFTPQRSGDELFTACPPAQNSSSEHFRRTRTFANNVRGCSHVHGEHIP